MLGLFKKKSKVEVLQKKYGILMEEAFALSKASRVESDKKIAEAEEVMKQILALQNN